MNAGSKLGDFSNQAGAYSQSRPTYPGALVERLIAGSRARPGDAVADVGAGTGIFTALLAGRGFVITALEPNEPMRRAAPRLAGVAWHDGTFESTGLPSASQQWVTAAQAFHWAKPETALPEMRRVLKPGGAFTVLWNNRENDANAVLAWTRDAIRRHIGEFNESYRDNRDWPTILTATGDFTSVACDEERHIVPMTRERYMALWRSHNHLANTAGPERLAAFLNDLEKHLIDQHIDRVDVPYLCRAWTAVRT